MVTHEHADVGREGLDYGLAKRLVVMIGTVNVSGAIMHDQTRVTCGQKLATERRQHFGRLRMVVNDINDLGAGLENRLKQRHSGRVSISDRVGICSDPCHEPTVLMALRSFGPNSHEGATNREPRGRQPGFGLDIRLRRRGYRIQRRLQGRHAVCSGLGECDIVIVVARAFRIFARASVRALSR